MPNSYDAIPYLTRPRRVTHPDTLAAVATLMGMDPAPLDRCRVLELGCGTGGNLYPQAAALPGSHFVGIDLSAVQVAEAQRAAQALGLTNVEFRAASILDLDDSLGEFDYVLCHGVYSWVPPAVREKILAVCGRHLAANGVALVSYNTYPGWHQRAATRDAMLYHSRHAATPEARVAAARAYLNFLAQAAPDPDEPYARVLKDEAERLNEHGDYYVFHEHLEADNQPIYFHEFADRAKAAGLQYLGEAGPRRFLSDLPAEVQKTLRDISADLIELEQNLDFLRNRPFRKTLLCRAGVPLTRSPGPDVVARLAASAVARPTSPRPDVTSHAVEEFVAQDGMRMSTNAPVVKAALVALFERWPASVPFDELASAVADRLGPLWGDDPERGRRALAQTLPELYLAGLLWLYHRAPAVATRPGERPVAFPVSRLQAADREVLTTALHHEVTAPPFDRFVLQLLDGTRDRAALAAAVRESGVALPDGAGESVEQEIEAALNRLAKSAVLVN